ALIAGIVVAGAETGIAGHADRPAVRSAGIDAALSAAGGAPLLRCAAGAAGSALAPVQGMIPAQVLVPSAAKTGAPDDRVRHPVRSVVGGFDDRARRTVLAARLR